MAITSRPTGPIESTSDLPAEPNDFIGRERDLAELAQLLDATRAVTLCGPGGIGKTRLSLRVAAEVAQRFDDGCRLVQLADLTQPELVPRWVAAAFGVAEEPGRSLGDTLIDAVGSRRVLLILDNCEHLIDACAELGQSMLSQAVRGCDCSPRAGSHCTSPVRPSGGCRR